MTAAHPPVLRDAPALPDGLLSRIHGAAGVLRERGAGPGSRVAIGPCVPDDTVAWLLGADVLGAAALVVAESWTARERDAVLSDAAPDVWVDRTPPRSSTPIDPHPGDDVLFYLATTSGSSGRPKVLARNRRSWRIGFDALGPLPGPVLLPGSPASSLFLFGALHAMHHGADVRWRPRLDTADLADVGTVHLVPAQLSALLTAPLVGPRVIVSGGAAVGDGLRSRCARLLPDTELVEYYGAAETSLMALRRGDGPLRPLPDVDIRVRDDELEIRTTQAFAGYLRSGRLEPAGGGFLRLGDRGSLSASGDLVVHGRGSATISQGGMLVAAEEVEDALRDVPGVSDVVVAGTPHSRLGEPGHGRRRSTVRRPGAGPAPRRGPGRPGSREAATTVAGHDGATPSELGKSRPLSRCHRAVRGDLGRCPVPRRRSGGPQIRVAARGSNHARRWTHRPRRFRRTSAGNLVRNSYDLRRDGPRPGPSGRPPDPCVTRVPHELLQRTPRIRPLGGPSERGIVRDSHGLAEPRSGPVRGASRRRVGRNSYDVARTAAARTHRHRQPVTGSGPMTPERVPVVVGARRTPIGTAGGVLREYTVDELAAPVLRAVLDDVDPGLPISDVLLGNVFGPGGNPARVAALRAGLGDGVPGVTVDRQCASGLSAIVAAATSIRAGEGEAYLAGGVESASTAPTRAWPDGTTYTKAPFAPAEFGDPEMGPAADRVAAEAGITRERQDVFAARSHARAVCAQRDGTFDAEIVPFGDVRTDQRPRDRFDAARLARFRPAFTEGGTATAANSCGVNDGAAVVLVVSERVRRALGVPGLALRASATRGCDPTLLGLGAVPAIRAVLAADRGARADGGTDPAQTLVADIDAVEFTEAFAGQVLACLDATGLDEQRVSPDGGAIALGHPWGASGAVLVVRLFHRLVRCGHGTTGLAALSSGGGLGVATLWEVRR